MYDIKIEKFEGPLDLLLKLIEREELDITQVALLKVTDQYIEHLRKLTEIPAEELADFHIAFTVDAFHLYELGADGVWRPKHDFRLGAAAQGE